MKLNKLEKKIVILFASPKSKMLDLFSRIISNFTLLVLIWILVPLVIICNDFYKGASLIIGLAIVFALHFLVSEGLLKWGAKRCFHVRIRPYIKYPNEIKGIGRNFSDSSFPSSHVAAMVAGLFVLISFYANILPFGILIVLMMAWSRLRNGMHYPSDILAGIVLGLVHGFIAMAVLNRIIA